jgi:hypothetical protein
MHERGFLYVDIKPHNFMIGYGERSQKVHVVDLGCWAAAGEKFANAGTLLYTSVQAHLGKGMAPARPIRFSADPRS